MGAVRRRRRHPAQRGADEARADRERFVIEGDPKGPRLRLRFGVRFEAPPAGVLGEWFDEPEDEGAQRSLEAHKAAVMAMVDEHVGRLMRP